MNIIPPMLAKPGKLPEEDDDYGFEIKWDGIRAILYISKGHVRILSRNLKDITKQYPELLALGTALPAEQAVLDGEIVAFTTDGRPSFSRLQGRMGLASSKSIALKMQEIPATYVIFDLLELNGISLLDKPYTERRKLLESLQLTGTNWQVPAYKQGKGLELLTASRTLDLEGIIAKRLDSPYQAGKRPGTWLKIKNQLRQELVIGGYVPGQGARLGYIGALLVGYYDNNQLVYAGAVGTGFSKATLNKLEKLLAPLKQQKNPFDQVPPQREATFVRPQLVAEFEFTEWTPNNTLRHPSFKGLRDDKQAISVVRET